MYAFADAFDAGYIIKYDLQSMLGRRIPMTMYTDSTSLFDVITKCSSTLEKRLMIDISAVRQAYEREEISDVRFVRTKDNPADAFTKVGKCEVLDKIMSSGKYILPIEQWVIRG